VEALKSEFLIGVTEFFRDGEAWSVIERDVLPSLLEAHRNDELPIRVWTPGCATGEESYSIAMLLLEQCAATSRPLQVFASDLDEEALAVARKGSYHESIAGAVSGERLTRFFERRGDRYAVRKELRDAVLFAPQNLLSDTPFSKLDLVICRNVLIYLEPVLQKRALDIFHFALRPRGYLLLGKAESLGTQTALFERRRPRFASSNELVHAAICPLPSPGLPPRPGVATVVARATHRPWTPRPPSSCVNTWPDGPRQRRCCRPRRASAAFRR
jgi:two-component system, chemotaxis family, CheB/CheR fusion protein